MFLFIGFLIGLNLATRIAIGETRELQAQGHARAPGQSSLGAGDIFRILSKAAPFLLVPTIVGQLLDLAFDTSVGRLLG